MYDKSDPRSALTPKSEAAAPQTGLVAEPQEAYFYKDAPQISDADAKTWLMRGHNFVLSWSEANAGARFSRSSQPDEYAVLLPDNGALIEWNGETTDVPGWSLAFVPAGDSTVTLPDGGTMTRLFTTRSTDLAEQCSNARGYDAPRTHIPEFAPWPEPKDGWKVRHYSLDVPKEEGRFGRIFRCTTMMVNVLDPFDGPRDSAKMSPHHHDDFEQCSLAIEGDFNHYLRWPWTTNMADWREDMTVSMSSPSALVIPPPVIHTTQAVGSRCNQLIDIFCPPRTDFSQKPGWVLNADDYPMPS
ncbi:hypothetical protein [Notoacmeibacter sp. MSK16QG-6]|uniref:hypothetical protein n=1 Tax=Notoacmeibacter sp. MSK16QG-6 TaxID=2957982 RepID=UPI00209D266A|nr:hypothetical protein [Notoacmeibacter sp. MSK16QG-6]MCP1198316.1 hypothetical protein [Notoacmeibacter sp. MSK16QG-6]